MTRCPAHEPRCPAHDARKDGAPTPCAAGMGVDSAGMGKVGATPGRHPATMDGRQRKKWRAAYAWDAGRWVCAKGFTALLHAGGADACHGR